MKSRTAADERRSGIRWLIVGAFFLAAMLGMWWLVATTNSEGDHDAELLPLFALIPLLIGLYHVVHSRFRHA
jgi:apolipoprotein N-acyltransferase